MGAVVDRTRENLGPSDVGTIQMRRTLMAAAKAVAERDATPPGLISNPPIIDPIVRFIPKSTPWEEIVQEIHGMPYEKVVFRI